MKKLLAMLVSLCLCLCAFDAVAESEVPVLELEPSYEGYVMQLSDTPYAIVLPGDWLTYAEMPEGAVGLYTDAEATIQLQVNIVDMTIDAVIEELLALSENGDIKDLFEIYLNEVYYMTYTSADDTMNIAYAPLDDTQCIVFIFTTPDPALYAESTLPLEIIGTIHVLEEVAE